MGTTLTALNTGNASVVFCAMIEGCPYVLTSGSPTEAFNAWQSSALAGFAEVGDARGGLFVDWGGNSQEVMPWKPFGDPPTCRLIVGQGGGDGTDVDDVFGIFVHKRTGGHETVMAAGASTDCNDLTISGRHSSGFAASGTIYVGPEAMDYSSVTAGGVFTISARGAHSPFQTSAGTAFARTHKAADPTATLGDPVGVAVPPLISDEPRSWIGKWVGVWILRNAGGVYDTPDQGHLAFAGTIASVGSDDAGRTVIDLDHAIGRIYETVLHRDQYIARLADGCPLRVGQSFGASQSRDTTHKTANALVVVSGTPASVNEIQAGRYTVQQLADAINEWLRAETAAARLTFHMQYTAYFSDASGGLRARWEYQDPTVGAAARFAYLTFPSEAVSEFMGWSTGTIFAGDDTTGGTVSPNTPRRWQREWAADGGTVTALTLINPRGTWISQNATLPVRVKGTSTTIDGVVSIDGIGYFAAKYINSTSMEVSPLNGGDFPRVFLPEMIAADSDAVLEVKQVVILESTFGNLLMQLLLSTGTSAFNSGTFDLLPEPLGCAIPYSLFTSAFEADVNAIENTDKAACIILDKPTRFADLMHADFALRWCALVWASGRIQCRAWTTPLSGYASVTLGESSKAMPAAMRDRQRSSAVEDLSAIYNVVKFEYGADGDGSTRDTLSIVDLTSARDFGSRALTIKARNASQRGPSAESIGELIASFSGTMGMFSRPFYRVRRPIAISHFEQVAPLSIIAYTDPHMRNPDTGLRGVSAWPAIVIGQSIDWGGVQHGLDGGAPQRVDAMGEVTLMLRPRIVAGKYAPAAKIDDTATGGGYSAGYAAGVPAIKIYADTYADGGNDYDYFSAGDFIRIIEIDPSVAGSPTTWTAQINTVSGVTFTLKAALGAPAWDAAKKYIVVPDTYSACQTSQQDKTYQADDADGLIENLRNPFGLSVMGSSQDPTFTSAVATTLPSRPSTYAYGDGKPLDVAYEFQAAELANNMASYKTAPMVPAVTSDTRTHSGSTDYLLTDVVIAGIGEGRFPAPLTRKLYVAPHMRSTDGNTATVRISLCRLWPQGDSLNNAILVDPYVSATFTTTSTTFVTATAQALDVRHINQAPGPFGGIGFVCVELKKGTTSNVEYDGLSVCRLGPLVTP